MAIAGESGDRPIDHLRGRFRPRHMCPSMPHSSLDSRPPTVRLNELLATLSLATDLGLGQPMEHVIRTCLIAVRLGEASGASTAELSTIYYAALLRFVGCTADAHEAAARVGGDEIAFAESLAPLVMAEVPEWTSYVMRFANEHHADPQSLPTPQSVLEFASSVIRAHCEVATMIARRLELGAAVERALWHGFARWDGRGFPPDIGADDLPLASRVAALARDVEVLTRTLGTDSALEVIRGRSGLAYDPRLVDILSRHRAWCSPVAGASAWEEFLAAEPGVPLVVGEAMMDRVLDVFADFADAKVPALLGHSRAVADVVERAARETGCPTDEQVRLRRAALAHDIGRVGVPNGIWERPGPLAPWEWERVKLHPYLSERMLARSGPLAALAPLAGGHHERLDGSGYHRGVAATALSRASRLLAAADVFVAMTQARPHRVAHTRPDAASAMREEMKAGRLDRDAADAVLAAGGATRPMRREPRGALSAREIEVLQLLCRGHPNREIAERLRISPKTVGHHVQHIYGKMGVSTRAALAILALERGLLQD